jgi:hypothetical protein
LGWTRVWNNISYPEYEIALYLYCTPRVWNNYHPDHLIRPANPSHRLFPFCFCPGQLRNQFRSSWPRGAHHLVVRLFSSVFPLPPLRPLRCRRRSIAATRLRGCSCPPQLGCRRPKLLPFLAVFRF